jgi:hypothetical protein
LWVRVAAHLMVHFIQLLDQVRTTLWVRVAAHLMVHFIQRLDQVSTTLWVRVAAHSTHQKPTWSTSYNA